MNKELYAKCQKLPIIKSEKTDIIYQGININGAVSIGFYDYSTEARIFESEFYKLGLIQLDYLEKFKIIYNDNTKYNKETQLYMYDNLTVDDILVIITYILREERFCDGLLARTLEDGTLENLSKRLHELTMSEE